MARLEAFQTYQAAASAVLDITKSELAKGVSKPMPRPTVGASPARPKSMAMSPARPQPTQSSYASGRTSIGEEPPLDEILRTLAISLPQDNDSSANLQVQANELASILSARRQKLDDVARNVQETLEHAAVKQVADAKLAIQLVRDSILAESPFGEVRLVDPEIEGSIAVLAQELANVEGKLKEVDAGVGRVRGRNGKRDELVRRWGP